MAAAPGGTRLIMALAAGVFIWLGLNARVPTLGMNFVWVGVLSALLVADRRRLRVADCGRQPGFS